MKFTRPWLPAGASTMPYVIYIYYLTGILGIGRIPVKQNKAIVKTYLAIGNSPTTALDNTTWPKFDRYRTEEL